MKINSSQCFGWSRVFCSVSSQTTTGCPSKHDSWWKGLNVFFHTLYKILKTFCSFSFKTCFTKIYFTVKSILLLYNFKIVILKMFLFYLVSNNLLNYGRKHFKLFTNCYVLWDTLYKKVYARPPKLSLLCTTDFCVFCVQNSLNRLIPYLEYMYVNE